MNLTIFNSDRRIKSPVKHARRFSDKPDFKSKFELAPGSYKPNRCGRLGSSYFPRRLFSWAWKFPAKRRIRSNGLCDTYLILTIM